MNIAAATTFYELRTRADTVTERGVHLSYKVLGWLGSALPNGG